VCAERPLELIEDAMLKSLRETFEQEYEVLSQHFDAPLRVIARRSVRLWFNRERLDQLLAECIGVLKNCELVYAIGADGRQVSSNIRPNSIDPDAYGQDLSQRPYAVSLSVLNNAAFRGAFLCDAYTSQVTQRDCVTVMYGVTSGSALLGYIAADFHPGQEQPQCDDAN
jgi:hypothetical protein